MPPAGLIALIALAGLFLGAFGGWLVSRRIGKTHPPEGEFLEIGGIRLHYRRSGDPARPAILVLHGAASNLEEPRMALGEAFAGENVIWLDRPGLGWSERPKSRRWSPADEAALIVNFLDRLEIPETVVIGHSWGGAIAMRLAMDHPRRITGLVLVAPALSAWIGEAAWFNSASGWPLVGPLLTRIIIPLVGHGQLAAGARSAFHPETVPDDYVAASRLPLILRPGNWIANARDMMQVNRHLEMQEEGYENITLPTVFLAGKADTVVWTHRHSGQVAARMAQAELRLISGAGHNLHHHHPRAVLEAAIAVRERAQD
ncbi:alpha/beta fold hydrolase [Maricaulis salignorans]|uniref:alpha/beta fold hydrolase n=1 Tax=Maricaulis salignorans TaxID=144026 RepID=UPI003A92B9FE